MGGQILDILEYLNAKFDISIPSHGSLSSQWGKQSGYVRT
jgi:hypothetical protein